jgi:hypothetical protein
MKTLSRSLGVSVLLMFAAACANQPDLNKATVGQDVALTKADGGVVEGKVVGRDDKNVQVSTGKITKSIPEDTIVDVKVVDPNKPADLPPVAKFREYTIPSGTTVSVKLGNPISSATSRVEDPIQATLAKSISVDGREVLPAGSTVRGVVSAVEGSGKVRGLARIAVRFTSVAAAGRDDRYDIEATYAETAETTKGEDATKIGIGAGAGAAIGALLGGKGGAAKGAAIGGGAGTATVLATKGEEVEHPVGDTLTATLKRDVDVRVPLK